MSLPKLKGLDLSIRADSTNLGFLATFIEGIFSEIMAVSTEMSVYMAISKHLDLEGEVGPKWMLKLMLNTYFKSGMTSIHISSAIGFQECKVHDR